MDNWMDNLRPSPQPQDEWAAERIHELATHCHAWTTTHKTAPPADWTNELASLTATWHAQQAAKAQANNGPRTAAASSDPDNQPTGEPLKLSEVMAGHGALPPDVVGHAPADPGIQAEADPWLVIWRINGHAWRLWEQGDRIEYAAHPADLFGRVNIPVKRFGSRWIYADDTVANTRFMVDLLKRRVLAYAMDARHTPLELSADAITWWPG